MIEVIEPGFQCTIQDLGRSSVEEGFAVAGAIDKYALRVANLLVGNDVGNPRIPDSPGAAGLEVTFFGTRLRFHEDHLIAVCGADLSPTLNGKPIPMWTSVHVEKGQELAFGAPRSGVFGYVAVAGGLDTPVVQGSRSTYLLTQMGGLSGAPLQKGDQLPVAAHDPSLFERSGQTVPHSFTTPDYEKEVELRVVMGPQDELFTEESLAVFLGEDWQLTPVFNRMGYRFSGSKLSFRPRPEYLSRYAGSDPSNIVDDTIPVGGIQVPSGDALVLMNCEGPTLGGYAKVATVVSSDMWKVAQMSPGDKARFEPITVPQAVEILRESESIFENQSA